MPPVAIALIGERNDTIAAHRGIPRALALAGAELGVDVMATWIRSDEVADPSTKLGEYGGIWCIPGSPYASMDGALAAISHARKNGIPFLGTCGGFQHALIEYARNVLGIGDADHAESSPHAARPIVVPLECPLVNVEDKVTFEAGSRLANAYGALETRQEYQCRFGVDEAWRARLASSGLRFTAFDAKGDARGAELDGHPFYVMTLFQPERAVLREDLPHIAPPIVRAFVDAARRSRRER